MRTRAYRQQRPNVCTCLPRSPDDQCPMHGYEQWLKDKDSRQVHVILVDEELLSECCGAPPFGEGLPAGEHPAGSCGQCREHTGFERGEA